MSKNSLIKRAAVLTMAGALAVTGIIGFAPRNVYANDGSYNYVTEGISVVDFDGTAVITSEYANIRDGASTTSPVIATVKKGRFSLLIRVSVMTMTASSATQSNTSIKVMIFPAFI